MPGLCCGLHVPCVSADSHSAMILGVYFGNNTLPQPEDRAISLANLNVPTNDSDMAPA